MREILISIRPEWVKKILNGEKTIEIRKTMPKCELPCKVYIYETTKKILIGEHFERSKSLNNFYAGNKATYITKKDYYYGKGKVVAEFTLNKVDTIEICDPYVFRNNEQEDWWYFKENACLDCEEMMAYIGYGSDHDGWGNEYAKGYAWHIDNLKIYDTPKELSEFTHYIPNNKCPKMECGIDCEDCMSYDGEHETCLALYYLHRQIKRPPQSYMFVEEIKKEQ